MTGQRSTVDFDQRVVIAVYPMEFFVLCNLVLEISGNCSSAPGQVLDHFGFNGGLGFGGFESDFAVLDTSGEIEEGSDAVKVDQMGCG